MLDGTPILDIKPYLSSVPPETCVADGRQRLSEPRRIYIKGGDMLAYSAIP
jgi:tRNA (Thr-GGU) A37 N-methylase